MTPDFSIGLGVDIVDCERIRRLVERGDEAFLRRVFTANERDYCGRMADPAPHYAARWAAKEAVAKALGTGIGASAALNEIEVIRASTGAPGLRLHGIAAATASRLGLAGFRLSLSHTKDLAIAVVQGLTYGCPQDDSVFQAQSFQSVEAPANSSTNHQDNL